MKTTMHIGTHPIHPMLIPLPIGFWIGSFLSDLYAWMRHQYHPYGYYLALAGCITALIAAVPGTIDLLTAVPSGTAARRTGIRHGLLNVVVLILFAISVATRPHRITMTYTAYVASALGTLLLLASGWLGGSLVYDHKVGVPGVELEGEGGRRE